MKNRIIVPTDLTEAAGQAIRQAVVIAQKTGCALVLLHVVEDRLSEEEAIRLLGAEAKKIHEQTGLQCEAMVKEGNIFDSIPHEACEGDYDLMVIGTHGVKGIRQMLMGADIMKLDKC